CGRRRSVMATSSRSKPYGLLKADSLPAQPGHQPRDGAVVAMLGLVELPLPHLVFVDDAVDGALHRGTYPGAAGIVPGLQPRQSPLGLDGHLPGDAAVRLLMLLHAG